VGWVLVLFTKVPRIMDFFFPRRFFFVPDSQRKKAIKKGEPPLRGSPGSSVINIVIAVFVLEGCN
jgi:hypothetical protein